MQNRPDEQIIKFLKKRHILSLCVSCDAKLLDLDELAFKNAGLCAPNPAQNIITHTNSCFYAYCEDLNALIIASSPRSAHIQIALQNPKICLNIALDTKIIGYIQGIQARADFFALSSLNQNSQKLCVRAYFVRYPYAISLNPTLYILKLTWLKYTNNALKNKLIWQNLI